jgi:hypothetical protein
MSLMEIINIMTLRDKVRQFFNLEDILGFMLYLGFHFHHWWNSSPLSTTFIIIVSQRVSSMHYFHLVHARDILGGVFFHLFPRPSNHVPCVHSCWMMGDASIPSFQWISSHRHQLIFSRIEI